LSSLDQKDDLLKAKDEQIEQIIQEKKAELLEKSQEFDSQLQNKDA
jgi:hypothetical protein